MFPSFVVMLIAVGFISAEACTGISLTAKDGSYIQARTIEWGGSELVSEYVIVPRGEKFTSYTPTGINGMTFQARYGMVGLSVVQKEFIVDGVNEAGLSAGLFYFPGYGKYPEYEAGKSDLYLSDLQFVSWVLSQFATVEEVKAAVPSVRIVALEGSSTVHWRVGDASGKQIVVEIVDGVPQIYDNKAGVLTNSPGFPWHVTNLNNYINLYAGSAPSKEMGNVQLNPFGAGTGFLGMPGDVTPPSRFIRAFFYQTTAPQLETGENTVIQSFHILNNFDIPIGVEFEKGKVTDIPSATQWTSVVDLTHRKLYYRTMYNSSIRCIDLNDIDFTKTKLVHYPLDEKQEQPIVKVKLR